MRLSVGEASHLLPAWTFSEAKLQREYKFQSFGQAWEFMRLVRQLGLSHKDFPLCKNHANTVNVALSVEQLGLRKQHISLASFIDMAEQQIKSEAEA